MAPVVMFPDSTAMAVAELRDELAARLATDPVVRDRIPNPRPATLVTVTRVGGPNEGLVRDNPSLAVECWATRPEDAHDLAQTAWAVMRSWAGRVVRGVSVYRVDTIAGPQDFPDPLSTQPRYTFTVSLSVRGAAA